MRILVVDDEQPLRKMMRLTLEAAGYEVGEAEDGTEALDAWHRQPPWDAVLLDQRLPGMDGLEVLRRLREDDTAACVVMVTAYASIDLAVDAMKLGASDFLRKPMTPETLGGAVAAALGKRAGRAATLRESPPPIETLTMNGFSIVRAGANGAEHRFRVRRFRAGTEMDVVVAVHPDAAARVDRLARHRLSPAGAFWTLQAERALANHLWRENAPPEGGRLEVADVAREDLDVASAWKSD
jgi:DNA-binding response OmpR family regulator